MCLILIDLQLFIFLLFFSLHILNAANVFLPPSKTEKTLISVHWTCDEMIFTISANATRFFLLWQITLTDWDDRNSAQSLIASLTSTAPYSSDLEELQNILHFPEEVALRLTDAEYQMYYQVAYINPQFCFNKGWKFNEVTTNTLLPFSLVGVAIEITVDVHRKSQFRLM